MLDIVRVQIEMQRAGLVYSKCRMTEIVKSFIAYIVTRQYRSTIKIEITIVLPYKKTYGNIIVNYLFI